MQANKNEGGHQQVILVANGEYWKCVEQHLCSTERDENKTKVMGYFVQAKDLPKERTTNPLLDI